MSNFAIIAVFSLLLILRINGDEFAVQTFKCNGKLPSDGSVCLGRGKCINENICACNNGYRGENCQLVPYENCKKLDSHFIEWNVKPSSIQFRITTTAGAKQGWAGIGFNNDMVMKGGSLIVGYRGNTTSDVYEYNSPGHDVYVNNNQRLKVVNTQVVLNQLVQTFERNFKGKKTVFTKNIDVSDPTYFELKNETIYFLVASHSQETPMYNASVMKHDYYGVYQFNLFEKHPCEFNCFGKNSSDPQVCFGNGTCYYDNVCLCKAGIYGQQCSDQIFDCWGYLSTNATACSARGKCTGPNFCTCDRHYVGQKCETYNLASRTSFISYFLLVVMAIFYFI